MDFITIFISLVLFGVITALGNCLLKSIHRWSDPIEIRKRKSLYRYLAANKCVKVVSTITDLEAAWIQFSSQLNGVMGLDCEWTTIGGQAGPVALLQLALPSGACLLVRVSHLESDPRFAFPSSMKEALADRSILKFGVAVTNDADKFFTDFGLHIRGCIDLRHLVIRIRNNGLKTRGLKNIAKVWLGIVYESGKHVQCSVWDNKEPLSANQVEYSAMDALVAVYAVAEFLFRKKKLKNMFTADEMQTLFDEELNYQKLRPFCQGLVDKRFKFRSLINYPDEMNIGNGKVKKSYTSIDKKVEKHNRIPQRKRPLYTNAVMLAPDGEKLCTLDAQKAQWYLLKGLAALVSDENAEKMTIQLNFEPSGRETGGDWQYYVEEKVNQCVVCGATDAFAKKHIVPSEYRRHFPKSLKGHKSHDVLLLCLPCHRRSSLIDDDFKRTIAQEYDAPQGCMGNVAYNISFDAVTILRSAKALRTSGHKIPEPRHSELRDIVRNYVSSVVDMEKYSAMSLEDCLQEVENNPPLTRQKNENFLPHGEIVVSKLSREVNGIINFETRWRQHFLDSMDPKYLPNGWSVNHRRSKYLFGRAL